MPLDQLDPSVFAKARTGKGRDNVQKQREIAALEAQVYHLTEVLGEQRQATRENVERKQARTSDELEVCSIFLCILVISIHEHICTTERKQIGSAFSNVVDFVAGRGRA